MGNIWLCKHCIGAIRSRGEKVFVSDEVSDELSCEWCEDDFNDVYDCLIRE